MAKKFVKIASRFSLSGLGRFNVSKVLVSKDAIFLIPDPMKSAVDLFTYGVILGPALEMHGKAKRERHSLYHDLQDLKVTRQSGWPAHKSGHVFVIPKRQVTKWTQSAMRGLVIKVAGYTAKIDVGVTGQGRAREALKQFGWNAVMNGSPEARRQASRRDEEDEWEDEDEREDERSDEDEWEDEDEFADSQSEYEDEDADERPDRRRRQQRSRRPEQNDRDRPRRRRPQERQRRSRMERNRGAQLRNRMLYFIPPVVGFILVVIIGIYVGVTNLPDQPAPRDAAPRPGQAAD